jgi:2',3'-cyclic-nucleotide 2'-phosphodiesterase (5'-nucleotidase family)
MVKVKKNKTIISYFVFLLTFFVFLACQTQHDVVYEIKNKQINVNEKVESEQTIEHFVTPYRNHITSDLAQVLAFNPIDQDKSKGEWETNIGNLFAQSTFELANPVFQKKENKILDGCILNHGGIRAMIPKGNVTTRTAFNIMPFENSVVVVGLSGNEIIDLAHYFLKEKKPHPLYGIVIFTDATASMVKKVEINQQEVHPNKVYYIATSDYLANGGDNMFFLKNSTIKYDLDYKLRSLFIDYFTKVDTLPNLTAKHVIKE